MTHERDRGSNEASELVTRCSAAWQRDGLATVPASDVSLDAFEAQHQVVLPAVLRELYRRSDGTADAPTGPEFDGRRWMRFMRSYEWRVERWDTELGPRRVVVFVDFFLATYFFGVAVEDDELPVLREDGPVAALASPTLVAFLEAYLDDSAELHR